MEGTKANYLNVSQLNIVNTTRVVSIMEGFRKKRSIVDLRQDRKYTSGIYSPEKRWNSFKSSSMEEAIYSFCY